MPAPANLIREESTSTGTGNLTLAAVNGYVRFSDSTYGFGTGGTDDFWYFISNRNAAEWEIGTGHMSDSNTLVRDTVLFSSNSNAAVSFSAGTKDISNDIPASYQVFVEGTPAQGDIIYRGASAWARLAAGSVGQALWTGGAGSNPAWAGGLRLLNSGTVSSAATLDIVLTSYTAYRGLLFKLTNFIPATDGILSMRVSTDGGSNYDAGASDYAWAYIRHRGGNVTGNTGDTADDAIDISGADNIESSGGPGVTCDITLMNQTATNRQPAIWATGLMTTTNPDIGIFACAGRRLADQDTDAVRFLFSSGNIASGNWALYGYS
jgi:hypothetical protein